MLTVHISNACCRTFWHQCPRRRLSGHTGALTHLMLGGPTASTPQVHRYARLFLTFTVSGRIHRASGLALGVPKAETGALLCLAARAGQTSESASVPRHTLIRMFIYGATLKPTRLSPTIHALCRAGVSFLALPYPLDVDVHRTLGLSAQINSMRYSVRFSFSRNADCLRVQMCYCTAQQRTVAA